MLVLLGKQEWTEAESLLSWLGLREAGRGTGREGYEECPSEQGLCRTGVATQEHLGDRGTRAGRVSGESVSKPAQNPMAWKRGESAGQVPMACPASLTGWRLSASLQYY